MAKFSLIDIPGSDLPGVRHNHFPRFLAKAVLTKEHIDLRVIEQYDDVPNPNAKGLAQLMRVMGDWYMENI